MKSDTWETFSVLNEARRAKMEVKEQAQLEQRNKIIALNKFQKELKEQKTTESIQKQRAINKSLSMIKKVPLPIEIKLLEQTILHNARKQLEIDQAQFHKYKLRMLNDLANLTNYVKDQYRLTKQSQNIRPRVSSPEQSNTTKRFFKKEGHQEIPKTHNPQAPIVYLPQNQREKNISNHISPQKRTPSFMNTKSPKDEFRNIHRPSQPLLPQHTNQDNQNSPYFGQKSRNFLKSTRSPIKDIRSLANLPPLDEANLSVILNQDLRNLHDTETDRSLLTEYRLMNDIKAVSDMTEHTPVRRYATHND